MNLICNRVLVNENECVLTAEFTDSDGITVSLRQDLRRAPDEGFPRPLVGQAYKIVPVDE